MDEVRKLQYDISGRLQKNTNPDGTGMTYDYDKLDELVSKQPTRDKTSQAMFGFDADGRKVSMEDVVGSNTYEYDGNNRIKTVVRFDGAKIFYEYDEFGNLSKLIYPDQTSVQYFYDDLNLLVKITDRAGKGTKTTQSAVYSFDSADRMLKVDNYYDWEHHVMTWQYDENRLVAIRDNIQLLIAALYDGNGDRIFTVQPKWDESGWHDNWNNGEWTTNGMWDGDWEG